MKKVLYKLVEFSIVEKYNLEAEKTMEARNTAASNVDPVIIRSGDIIVREGQVITNEIYEELKLVGLLKQQQKLYPTVGLILFIILFITIISYEFMRLYHLNELYFMKI